jgi:hypothetical protein
MELLHCGNGGKPLLLLRQEAAFQQQATAPRLHHAQELSAAKQRPSRGPHGSDDDRRLRPWLQTLRSRSQLPNRRLLLEKKLQDPWKRRRQGGSADIKEERRRGVQAGHHARRRRVQPRRPPGRRRRHDHGYGRCHGQDLPPTVHAHGLFFAVALHDYGDLIGERVKTTCRSIEANNEP